MREKKTYFHFHSLGETVMFEIFIEILKTVQIFLFKNENYIQFQIKQVWV